VGEPTGGTAFPDCVPAECDSTQAGDGQGVDLEARLLDATRFSLRADRGRQETEERVC
jgi:hypothetical protein